MTKIVPKVAATGAIFFCQKFTFKESRVFRLVDNIDDIKINFFLFLR